MSVSDYDPNWWHRIDLSLRLSRVKRDIFVNCAKSGSVWDTGVRCVGTDEPQPDPRNYRGADWSEVG